MVVVEEKEEEEEEEKNVRLPKSLLANFQAFSSSGILLFLLHQHESKKPSYLFLDSHLAISRSLFTGSALPVPVSCAPPSQSHSLRARPSRSLRAPPSQFLRAPFALIPHFPRSRSPASRSQNPRLPPRQNPHP